MQLHHHKIFNDKKNVWNFTVRRPCTLEELDVINGLLVKQARKTRISQLIKSVTMETYYLGKMKMGRGRKKMHK